MSSRFLRLVAACLVALCAVFVPAVARAAEHVKMTTPDKEDLQYLAFWYARAGGFFDREGIELELVIPKDGKMAATNNALIEKGLVDASILAPTAYLRAIGNKAPVVVVANLFANVPHALVVRRDIADEQHLSATGPLRERVAVLKGKKIGVPPAAYAQLRALLTAQGLDPDKDVELVTVVARDQKTVLKDKKVDAFYASSPMLEHQIAQNRGIVLVSGARGEEPALATRQTNVLVVSRAMIETRRGVVTAMVRAIAAAEKSIHTTPAAVAEALAKDDPGRDLNDLQAAVTLYEPGVPATPEVHAEDFAPALKLFPDGVPKPDFAGMDFAPFVTKLNLDPPKAGTESSSSSGRWVAVALGVGVVLVGLYLRAKKKAKPDAPASKSS